MQNSFSERFTTVGTEVAKIPVSISYRIIELFSAGLYSSPNKAIEELVSNSYDAFASRVDLLVPTNLRAAGAVIWVVDDGQGMDIDGLIDLWQIARSRKRTQPSIDRPPIGKFGIGKLATYVLAQRLTHLSKQGGSVRGVTMDFTEIDPEAPASTEVTLAVRELTEAELADALTSMRAMEGGSKVADRLLAADHDDSWTAAALSQLRPAAEGLQLGRIRWLLSTALPMSPAFKLAVNGKSVVPSLARLEPLKAWDVGENAELPPGVVADSDEGGRHVTVDGLAGVVRGRVEVFADVLTKGKASELGRSHGFFVMVRGRLINLDDALFGIPALSHATFNRFRMVVQADGLDDFLASTRESVMESPAVGLFRGYLREEFNFARKFYDTWAATAEAEARVSTRVGRTAASLSRRPIVEAVRALLTGSIDHLSLIQTPVGLDDDQKSELLESLEASLETTVGPIEDVTLEPLGVDRFIAAYEPVSRTVQVNTLHPFFANFIEDAGSHQPFELLAVAEVLTEAYLVEERADPQLIARLIARRDAFFRDLVSAQREGPAVIAQNLRDQVADEKGLEDAVAAALRSLGYEVSPIGGNGKPDGLAKALLGVRSFDAGGARDDYSLTFDAKSTGGRSVATKTVGVSTLARHRRDYKADFSIVVAVGFEGAGDRSSPLGKECADQNVTPITTDDLALLVQVAAVRQVGFRRLRQWLETCRTPGESSAWVRTILDEPDESPPIQELLSAISDLQHEGDDPVEVAAVVVKLRDRHSVRLSRDRVVELIKSLQSLAPGFISFDGAIVTLEMSIEKVKAEIARHHRQIPDEVLRRSYLLPFLKESEATNAADDPSTTREAR